MTQRYVYSSYPTISEAEKVADELVSNGISKEHIYLVANEHIAQNRDEHKYDVLSIDDVSDSRSWWEKLFGIGDSQESTYEIDYSQYDDALKANKILLVVNREYEGMLNQSDPARQSVAEQRTEQIIQSHLDASHPEASRMTADEFNTQSFTTAQPRPGEQNQPRDNALSDYSENEKIKE